MLEWRLKAYRHWLEMVEPTWPNVTYPPIDYQDLYYYSAPKSTPGPKSLDEVDPELLRTYEKLGIPLREQEILAGVETRKVAVDAVFDSVSVATTFKEELAKAGVIFCPISEAVHSHPELVKKYLGSVVPVTDNYFATLNSAVFSDGSFVYVPPGVRCPMELSTYFRINEKNTGQFERTLIIADKGSYVSYLEGCTAPMRDENQLHAAVVELVARRSTNRIELEAIDCQLEGLGIVDDFQLTLESWLEASDEGLNGEAGAALDDYLDASNAGHIPDDVKRLVRRFAAHPLGACQSCSKFAVLFSDTLECVWGCESSAEPLVPATRVAELETCLAVTTNSRNSNHAKRLALAKRLAAAIALLREWRESPVDDDPEVSQRLEGQTDAFLAEAQPRAEPEVGEDSPRAHLDLFYASRRGEPLPDATGAEQDDTENPDYCRGYTEGSNAAVAELTYGRERDTRVADATDKLRLAIEKTAPVTAEPIPLPLPAALAGG